MNVVSAKNAMIGERNTGSAGAQGAAPVRAAIRAPSVDRRVRRFLCLDDFERAARRFLPRMLHGFVAGGAETEASVRANRDSFAAYALLPRMLVDTRGRSQTRTLFGRSFAAPFGIAPMGLSALLAFRGDLVLARAAAASNIPMVLSASSLIPMEAVRTAGTDWLQAYLPGEPDRIEALVARALAAGFGTLMLTVDIPVPANRENNTRNGFTVPLEPSARLVWEGVSHPVWLFGTAVRTLLRHGMPHFENMDAGRGPPILSRDLMRATGARDRLDWTHVALLRRLWPGTLVVKGSGPTLAVIDMVAADGRPMVNPQAQTPSIVYPNGIEGKPRPNVFSVSVGNAVESEKLGVVLAKFAKVGIVHESTGYGVTGAELVKKQILKRRPDAAVTQESFNQRAQDMTAQLVRVQRAGAEAMLVIGLGADFAVIRRNMSRLNMTLALFGTTGSVGVPYQEGAGDLVVGTRAASYVSFGRRPMSPATQAFVDLYRAKYGTDRWYGPDAANPLLSLANTVGSGYDSIGLLLDGIRRTGSTDREAVVRALDGTKDYAGASIAAINFTPQEHTAMRLDDLGMFEMAKRDGRVVMELMS